MKISRTSARTSRSPRGALSLLVTATALAALTLTSCSAEVEPETDTAASTEASPSTENSSAPEGEGEARTPSGVSGLIASAQDGVLQVQSSDTQTTVRYTDATTISTTVSTDVSSIAIGDCVIAVTGEDEAVTSITVTSAEDGECGVGGFGGGFPGGGAPGEGAPDGENAPTDRPSDMPTDMPSGMPTDRPECGEMPECGSFGGFTSGTVTAVSAEAITVEVSGEDGETTSETLAVNAETTVTTTADGTSTDIAEGRCVTAQGEADTSGGYDATSLSLSDADENGECQTMGAGGFGGGPGGFGGAPGSEGRGDDE